MAKNSKSDQPKKEDRDTEKVEREVLKKTLSTSPKPHRPKKDSEQSND